MPTKLGNPIKPADAPAGDGFVGNGLFEKDIFYYHSDHLGSTNYVTGITGQITEHIETMAFGEILFEEHSSSFTTPYVFTGLELDRETNLTYASQRYLDMKTSIFVGVDKIAEKYPNFGGYIYAMQNPIRLIDPTGMGPDDWIERKGKDGKSTFFYDSTVKTNEQAVAAYGDDVNIVKEGTRTESTSNGKADGRYSYTYHNDGTVSDKNGQNVDFSNGNLTTTGGTVIVNPENKSGTFSGFSMGGAVGGGISFELGLVSDSSGGKALYFTFGGNSGFGGGYGVKGGIITPTGNNPFSVTDFAGKGNSYSGGFGTVSYERGGTQGNGFSDYGSYIKGTQERPYIYQAGSQTGHYPSISVPKIQLGGTISETKTWVFKL